MKKIIFTFLALVGTMSMNAQVIEVYKDNVLVAKYKSAEANNVVFKEELGTTGKTKATIGGSEVAVNWVQLWEDGPRFAEYNVDGEMTFTDAIKTGTEFVWGAKWRTPSKEEFNELLRAANGESDSVTCKYEQVNGVWGFNFTGKGDYAGNSVFFPAPGCNSDGGGADYWSGTADGGKGWRMNLFWYIKHWSSEWLSNDQNNKYLVRPMLAE